MKTKDLSELSYYQGIYGDHILLGNGDMVFGYRIWFPPLWTQSRDRYKDIDNSILSLIKRLPNHTTTQWSYYVYDDTYRSDYSDANNRIEIEDLRSWDKAKVVNLYCELYITVSNVAVNKISETDNPLIRMKNYLLDKPFTKVEETIEKYKTVINTITKTLEQNRYLKCKKLTGEELEGSIKRYFSQTYDRLERKHSYVPDILFEEGIMKVGNEFVGMVSLAKEGEFVYSSKPSRVGNNPYTDVDLPQHVNLPSSMAFDLTTGVPFSHIYNVCIEKVDREVADKELKKIKSNVKLLSFLGNGKASNIRKEIGGDKGPAGEIISEGFIDAVDSDDLVITRSRVNIIVKDPSKEVLIDKMEFLINTFSDMNGSDAIAENGHLLNLFMASAPGCMRFNYRSLWQVGQQSIRYLVKENLYESDHEGLRFVDRTGKPVRINTWQNEHIVNRNSVIFAPSGSGKSVLLNGMVNQFYGQGNYIIIIDVGGSFKRNTLINDGYYFDAGIKENLRFNIFLCDQDEKGNYLYSDEVIEEDSEESGKDDHLNFVASILIKLWKGNEAVDRETLAVLKKTIAAYYNWINENKGFPDLIKYYKYLSEWKKKAPEKILRFFDIEAFLLVLEEYVDGQYKELLNSKENMKLSDQRMLVFDLEAIKDNNDINEIVIAIVMYYAAEIINTKRGRKNYIVDEAIDYMKGDMGDFIAGLYRKIRKRNGQVTISTQGIGYLSELSELVRKSIFGNTSTVWLLSHKEDRASYPLLQQELDLTEGQLEMLESVGRGENYREVLLKMGTGFCEVVRMQISKFALSAFTTDPDEVDQLEEFYQKSGNHIVAIQEFLESQEKKKIKYYKEKNEKVSA